MTVSFYYMVCSIDTVFLRARSCFKYRRYRLVQLMDGHSAVMRLVSKSSMTLLSEFSKTAARIRYIGILLAQGLLVFLSFSTSWVLSLLLYSPPTS